MEKITRDSLIEYLKVKIKDCEEELKEFNDPIKQINFEHLNHLLSSESTEIEIYEYLAEKYTGWSRTTLEHVMEAIEGDEEEMEKLYNKDQKDESGKPTINKDYFKQAVLDLFDKDDLLEQLNQELKSSNQEYLEYRKEIKERREEIEKIEQDVKLMEDGAEENSDDYQRIQNALLFDKFYSIYLLETPGGYMKFDY